jgi:uracil-DNA glycosylase
MTLVLSIKKSVRDETINELTKFPVHYLIISLLYEPKEYPLVLVNEGVVVVHHEDEKIMDKVKEEWKDSTIFSLEDLKSENYFVLVSLSVFNSWTPILKKMDLRNISRNVYSEAGIEVYPAYHNVFRIFQVLPLEKVKVVFIFQDPYKHRHACGIAVSSHEPKLPPTLETLIKVLVKEGFKHNEKKKEPGNLISWVNQGVFLFNVSLTVGKGEGRSHYAHWEALIRDVCLELNKNKNLVVCLFGNKAKELKVYLKNTDILLFSHPSPLSQANFDNVVIYSDINKKLKQKKVSEINWDLD